MYSSAAVLFRALYNFSYVIRNGAAYDIHASQFSTIILILHAALSTVTTTTFGIMCYFSFQFGLLTEQIVNVVGQVNFYSVIFTQISMLYVLNQIGTNSKKVYNDLIENYDDEYQDTEEEDFPQEDKHLSVNMSIENGE